jgi:hypothetical protein
VGINSVETPPILASVLLSFIDNILLVESTLAGSSLYIRCSRCIAKSARRTIYSLSLYPDRWSFPSTSHSSFPAPIFFYFPTLGRSAVYSVSNNFHIHETAIVWIHLAVLLDATDNALNFVGGVVYINQFPYIINNILVVVRSQKFIGELYTFPFVFSYIEISPLVKTPATDQPSRSG